ncbi:MAG: GNAT family N-acetyltransferase [Clostridiales bacterium]|nr:GNAT family N-acetyltransferase [Clostridiales bacterium]
MEKFKSYEELSLNAHPALQTEFYDGWALRYADGYTRRANSVNILYPSTLNIAEKIAECEKRYTARNLPVVFKITENTCENLDGILEEKGYAVFTPTNVMETDLSGANFEPHGSAVFSDYADREWQNAFFALSRLTDQTKMCAARRIFANVNNTVICARIISGGKTVSCGAAVIERGYAGIMNVVMDMDERRKGYGAKVCEALLAAAKKTAHTSYLQVEKSNSAAINMYAKLGYKPVYSYLYRVKV